MAEQQINQNYRYARYGRIMFVWVALGDDYIVNNRVDDSLSINVGGKERHPWDYNNNELTTARREGRPQPSAIAFRVKRSDLSGSDELYVRQLAVASGDGLVPSFTTKVELLDANGVATGELLTFDDCVFAGGVEFSESQNNDEMPINIECPHEQPALTQF